MNLAARRPPLWLAPLLFALVCGCGGKKSEPKGEVTKHGVYKLAVKGKSGSITVNVPKESVSLTIMADSVDGGDIDISTITSPEGDELLANADPANDPIGRNFAQGPGQSTVSFTLPHTGRYQLTPGDWRFEITHYDSADGRSRDVTAYSYVKPEAGAKIGINLWMVGLEGYQGEDDPVIADIIDAFTVSLANFGVEPGKVTRYLLEGEEGARLTYVNARTDKNKNFQPDTLDELYRHSEKVNDRGVNIFFVTSFIPSSIIGISGGIPGPQLLQGTSHSGVAVSLLGGLKYLSAEERRLLGGTVAHELGHYLGLFHTTERKGTSFDPLDDTPTCPAKDFDKNGDGIVTGAECIDRDGTNRMFWAAARFDQEVVTDTQRHVVSLAPAVTNE